MLSVTRSAYTQIDPSRLLAKNLSAPDALRRHLIDQILILGYPDERERQRARWWLSWLAQQMRLSAGTVAGDLAWWNIQYFIPSWQLHTVRVLRVAFTCWPLVFLAYALVRPSGSGAGTLNDVVLAGILAFMIGAMSSLEPNGSTYMYPRMLWMSSAKARLDAWIHLIAGGTLFVALFSVSYFASHLDILAAGLNGLAFGISIALISAFAHSFRRPTADAKTCLPLVAYRADRHYWMVFASVFASSVGVIFGFQIFVPEEIPGSLLGGLSLAVCVWWAVASRGSASALGATELVLLIRHPSKGRVRFVRFPQP